MYDHMIFKCKGHPPESLSNAFVWNIPSVGWRCILLPLFCLSTPILVRTSRQSPPDNSHRRPRVLFVNNPHNVDPQIEFQNDIRFESLYLQTWWQLDVGSGGFIRRNSEAAFSTSHKNFLTFSQKIVAPVFPPFFRSCNNYQ